MHLSGVLIRNPEKGAFARGVLRANQSQIARKFCAKLPVFCFIHQRKGVRKSRKFVANLKVDFAQFYAIPPLSDAPFSKYLFLKIGKNR